MSMIELNDKRLKLVADARSALDEITKNTDDSRAAELDQRHDTIMGEVDKLDKQIEREQSIADAEKRAKDYAERNRPTGEDRTVAAADKGEVRTYEQAFDEYLRRGLSDLSEADRKIIRENRAQSVGTTTEGGYTVPTGFVPELIKSLKAWGPMLDPGITSELVTSSGNQLQIPAMNDTSNVGVRLAENTVMSAEGDLVFAQKVLDAYKYSSGPILVSSELLQDSALPFENIVRAAMAERIARKVNLDLTVGDGSGDPNGVVTASTLGKTAASATAVTFDELIDLVHSVDPAYRDAPTCRFMFADAALKSLRKLKDGNSNYIWSPADARTGEPASLLGFAYSINQAMPAMTTGLKSFIFGDMSKYMVRRVREFAVRRLDERYAEYDQAGFIGFARFDGELLDTAAVKHLIQA